MPREYGRTLVTAPPELSQHREHVQFAGNEDSQVVRQDPPIVK